MSSLPQDKHILLLFSLANQASGTWLRCDRKIVWRGDSMKAGDEVSGGVTKVT